MKYKLFCLLIIISVLMSNISYGANPHNIIKKVEDNLTAETARMSITMTVKTKRVERTMKMESYSIGREKSFIRIVYPGKSRGITFLKIDNTMWQYVPRIERIIRIPASMMLQSWMGSDFTNDDLVRESSLYDDYTSRLLRESESEYEIELLPVEGAAVVWGKIIMTVSKKYYLPTRLQYFDEDNILVRELLYTNVQLFGERFYPAKWLMIPKTPDKIGSETRIEITGAVFDSEISSYYFTKRALRR